MFCTHCGREKQEYQKFCGFCGKPLSFAHEGYSTNFYGYENTYETPNIGLIRQQEVEKIDKVISYFAVQQNAFDEHDTLAKNINHFSRINAKMALIWSIILFSVSFFGLLKSTSYNYYYYLNQFLVCSTISGGLLILFFLLNKRRKTKLEEFIQRYGSCRQYLLNCYYTYKYCPVGLEYANPYNLAVVRGVILSGRANTINDALNFLIEASQRRGKQDYPYMAIEYLVATQRIPVGSLSFRNGKFFEGLC